MYFTGLSQAFPRVGGSRLGFLFGNQRTSVGFRYREGGSLGVSYTTLFRFEDEMVPFGLGM